MTLVVPGEGSQRLANEVAERLKATLAQVETKTFPDGEEYLRVITNVSGEDVVVIQTTYPPTRLWRLLLMLSACREGGARRVRAIVPYLAYARQDRLFNPGEALSSKVVAAAIGALAHEVLTVDAHKEDIRAYFGVPFANVSSEEPLSAELERQGVDVVLAPDAGAMPRARSVAQRIGAQFDYLEKKRISSEIVEMTPKTLDVKGKSVCILDDIISTGGTMAKALEQLKRNGAKDILAACVHGLFIDDAVHKLKRAGARDIIATNTIDGPHSRVSVAEPLVRALEATATAVKRR